MEKTTIAVKVPFTGQIVSFWPVGIGAYPYECRAKDKYPKSMIYENGSLGWVAEHQLTDTGLGYFEIR